MSDNKELLDRIRKLNWLLSESTVGYVSFDQLCGVLAEMLSANVHVLSKGGKVLASVREAGGAEPFAREGERVSLPKRQNDLLMQLPAAMVNVTLDEVKELYGPDYCDSAKYHVIEPVYSCGDRVATMLFARPDVLFSEEDVVLCELGSTIVGMQVAKGLDEEEKEVIRGRESVMMAIDRLSYSELAAVQTVFEELTEDDSLLVASKIADKYKITRSVIVNALRKLESAGVIETRSLGMKGTRIKILNPFLREQIRAIEI